MEKIIDGVLRDYENGKIGRRQLIQSLVLGVGAAAATPIGAAAQGNAKAFKAIFVNHISYRVADYQKTRDFYRDLLGMTVTNDDGKNQCYLRFGDSVIITRNSSPANPDAKPPNIDHMAYMIEDWDTAKVRAELERRGLKGPRGDALREDIPAAAPQPHYISFHVGDSAGYDVEISGVAKPGDAFYDAKPNVQNAVPPAPPR